jgi:hypothetical protein
MAFRECIVSFRDRHGISYNTKVDAETAYEAAALALKYWSRCRYVDGPDKTATLLVEVNRPARLLAQVKMPVLLKWLYVSPPKTDAEAARIRRLRDLLADDRR